MVLVSSRQEFSGCGRSVDGCGLASSHFATSPTEHVQKTKNQEYMHERKQPFQRMPGTTDTENENRRKGRKNEGERERERKVDKLLRI